MATKKPTNTKAAAQKTPLTAKIDRMSEREDATANAYASGETKYSDIAFALTDEARQSLNEAVLTAYKAELAQSEEQELDDPEDEPVQQM